MHTTNTASCISLPTLLLIDSVQLQAMSCKQALCSAVWHLCLRPLHTDIWPVMALPLAGWVHGLEDTRTTGVVPHLHTERTGRSPHVLTLNPLQFEALQNVIRKSGLDFPDTAFIFNLHDLGVCDKKSNCAAPVLSTYSHKDDTYLLLPVGGLIC
jgi:hypothetical protein